MKNVICTFIKGSSILYMKVYVRTVCINAFKVINYTNLCVYQFTDIYVFYQIDFKNKFLSFHIQSYKLSININEYVNVKAHNFNRWYINRLHH